MSSIGSRGPSSWHARLIQAAGKGDAAKVQDLVEEGYPNETTYKDALRIALQRVVSRGNESLTRLLLEKGAQVNVPVEAELSPLHRAAELGHQNIVKALIEHGADPNSRDRTRQTPIFPAAQRNHPQVLKSLLEAGADVNVKDEDGQTLMLCLAAEKAEKLMKWGNEIIEILLETNLDLEVKDKDGRTALLWAAATGKESLAKLLLTGRVEGKANIGATNHRGKTALHLAVESKSNRVAVVKLLLQNKAVVGAQSDGGWTALHNAAEKGFEDVASLLLEWTADANATTSSGMTPLHWCARNGHINIVKLLLRQQGIRIHRKDSFEETPMLGAAQNGHIDIARLLSPTNDGVKLSLPARAACDGFQATIVDFGMEHRPMNHRKYSVFDLLYGWDDDKQKPAVTTLARNVPAQPAFRWIHLPTNNLAWVETLITKHFIEDSASDVDGFKALEKLLGQQHRGPTVHSFFMRPLCQRMQPTGKSIPASRTSGQDSEGPRVKPEIPTPLIVLPDQENLANVDHKPPAERKPSQSDKRLKNNKAANTGQQSNNAFKRANESAALMPRSQRKKGDGQPARSRTPVDKSRTDRKGNIVLFMPYLHYETHQNRKTMSEAIKRAAGDAACMENQSSHDCDEMLIQAYLRSTPNLHIRRTLDQFYYHAISTEDRDTDQVVYRYTREKRQKRKVFMVDQLWVWIIGKDLIVTSFPQRWKQPKGDPLNVLDGIIEDMNSKTRPPVKSVYDLATLITGRCSGVFDRHRLGDEQFQFLDMFESSIGQVTNKETELFMNFNDASKAAARWLTSQRQRGGLQLLSKPSGESESTMDHTFVDTLLDIGEETALLAETKDIRDELNMISMVLKHQVSVLDDMMHAILEEARGPNSRLQSEIKKRYREQHKVVELHLKDVERMDKQAEGIYTSLTHLLDLKQKHANAFEARFARDQAAFTGRQGQTIMVFTIVTIFFLPMSFIAAVFTIPVSEFPHRDGAPSIPFSYVSKITFGVGLAISIPLIAVAFALDSIGVFVRGMLRSMVFWSGKSQKPRKRQDSFDRRAEKQETELDEDNSQPRLLGRTSGDAYRRRVSSDLEQETHPMRRSIYSKDRNWRDSFRISADLERGDVNRLRSN
ncbi:MAG: hypothetical protein L6R36_000863 [Xanthoria steineri]|nr:MAG: hypothetical protein L6R36_000863 [Xanthoria steineri]